MDPEGSFGGNRSPFAFLVKGLGLRRLGIFVFEGLGVQGLELLLCVSVFRLHFLLFLTVCYSRSPGPSGSAKSFDGNFSSAPQTSRALVKGVGVFRV